MMSPGPQIDWARAAPPGSLKRAGWRSELRPLIRHPAQGRGEESLVV
jgi:hypothetical protein